MKTFTRIHLASLLALIALIVVLLATELSQFTYLGSLDANSHHFFTRFAESRLLYSDSVSIHNGHMSTPYLSFMRTLIYLLSQAGQIDTFAIYFFGSILLRVVYILLIVICTMAVTQQMTVALICAVLVFTSPYFVTQSYITFPENIALLFLLNLILGFEKYRQNDKIAYLFIVILSLVGGAYFFPPSLLISGIITLAYLLYFVFNVELRKVEYTLFSLIISLFLTFPIFPEIITSLLSIPPQANSLNFDAYALLIGYPVIILSMLGLIRCLRDGIRQKSHLLFITAGILIVSLGKPFQIGAYLYIPLILLSAIFLTTYIKRANHLSQFLLLMMISLLAISTTMDTKPQPALNNGEIPIAAEINSLMSENPNALLQIDQRAIPVASLLDYPARICLPSDPIFAPAKDTIPDCSAAHYHLSVSNTPIQGYLSIANSDNYFLHERLESADS